MFGHTLTFHVCLHVATLKRKPPWIWSASLLFSADIGSSNSVQFSAFLNGRYLPADLRGEITVSYSSPTGKCLKVDDLWSVSGQSRIQGVWFKFTAHLIVLNISGQLLTDCLLTEEVCAGSSKAQFIPLLAPSICFQALQHFWNILLSSANQQNHSLFQMSQTSAF